MHIHIKNGLWADNNTIALDLPEHWKTVIHRMAGDDKPPLAADDYRMALAGLKALCRGRKKVCILFDDTSRPTKAYEIMPFLLEQLQEGGVRDEQVEFICALGTHAALDNVAFRQKLGEDVLNRFPVYNHNPYENCDSLGFTTLGTPILVNREYLSCDLRIGIGACIPHSFCGFGGGYKMLLPGIAHVEAIAHHHGKLLQENTRVCTIGDHRGNPLLADIREFGARVGMDLKIDVLVNTQADSVDIYAGEPDGVYGAYLQRAQAHYRTRASGRADIVIVNTYAKGNEATIGLALAEGLLKDEGGSVVLLCDIPQGQVVHHTMGRFGESTWGRVGVGERKKDGKVRRLFIFSRYRDLAGSFWLGGRNDLSWHGTLGEIIALLADEYRGKTPDVHIILDGTIQTLSLE